MNKEHILLLLIVFFVSFGIYYRTLNKKHHSEAIEFSNRLTKLEDYSEKLETEYKNAFYNDWLLNNYVFSKSWFFVNSHSKEYSLNEIFENRATILLSFSEDNCPACISKELTRITNAKKLNIDLNFCVLTNFSNPRSFISFVKSRKVEIPIFTLKEFDSKLPSDIIGRPVYCLIDSQGEIINLFYPCLELNNLSDSTFKEAIHIIRLCSYY